MRRQILGGLALLILSGCSRAPETGPVLSGSEESVVSAAAHAARQRVRQTGLQPFRVEVQLEDRYGNESTQPALGFAWSDEDLARINYENIGDFQLVDLASVTILSPRGVIALAEWCDPDGVILTRRLCGSERKRAEDEWVARLAAT